MENSSNDHLPWQVHAIEINQPHIIQVHVPRSKLKYVTQSKYRWHNAIFTSTPLSVEIIDGKIQRPSKNNNNGESV